MTLSESCCGKNAEAAENYQNVQLVSVFRRFFTLSRVTHAAHKPFTIKALCVCEISAF
jgi:hypothetical protein